MTAYTTFPSPLGELLLVGEDTRDGVTLTSLSMPGQKNAPAVQPNWLHDPDGFAEITRQLAAYFAGELSQFDIEFTPSGTEIPATRVACAGRDPLRNIDHLRKTRRATGHGSRRRPRPGRCGRREPTASGAPLPARDRRGRQHARLRRRRRTQGATPHSRGLTAWGAIGSPLPIAPQAVTAADAHLNHADGVKLKLSRSRCSGPRRSRPRPVTRRPNSAGHNGRTDHKADTGTPWNHRKGSPLWRLMAPDLRCWQGIDDGVVARGASGRGLARTGQFGQQPRAETVRARPANVVDPAQLLEYPDEACRRVELARQYAMARARGVGVM